MDKSLYIINLIVSRIGKASSWLNIVIIFLIVTDVILRYLFNTTQTWVIEMEWHLFSILFLFGMSYALQQDKHIRVDLFYEKYSPRTQRIIDNIGHLFFLIPWCIVIMVTTYKYAANSFYIHEGSPNPGGLPYRYIIKSCIIIGFFLLLLSGIAKIVENVFGLKSKVE